ncbi:hypothetical protein ACFSL6_05470 [Paenibacillus thailandensis]|uniref:Uncharacterized protein n=1 Tax=Paenibacillus thailandensis TaxID=393250 RepID=A0ABW5QSM9_9BACL
METFDLIAIEFIYENETRRLAFQSAELVIVKEFGTALWYIDVNGIQDTDLLRHFGESENICVELKAGTGSGEIFEGTGYFHPNERHRGAAIRGYGELVQKQAETNG